MTKRFIKDNRGQVLYAVIVTIMFVGLLSMIAMGLTLKNYQASLQKQQHVTDYYAADAVAELIRIGKLEVPQDESIVLDADSFTVTSDAVRTVTVTRDEETYTIKTDTATIVTIIDVDHAQFKSWEVSYHAVETEADAEQDPT